MRPFPALVVALSGLSFCSCQPEKDKPVEKEAAEVSKPKHPWDWKPTEANLVAGREIYVAECSGCHNEGEEGAPSLLDQKSWQKREAKGLTVLLDHAINGYQGPSGEMPARGGTPSLSDEEVTNAVNYILASQKFHSNNN